MLVDIQPRSTSLSSVSSPPRYAPLIVEEASVCKRGPHDSTQCLHHQDQCLIGFLWNRILAEEKPMLKDTEQMTRRCTFPKCTKRIQSRYRCIAHGGGRRCQKHGCKKSAVGKSFCISHGGGRRCLVADCTKSSQSGGKCFSHGGGRRCTISGCERSRKLGGYCVRHGGGKKCSTEGCEKHSKKAGLCVAHYRSQNDDNL